MKISTLKELRTLLGLTQSELAAFLGIGRSHYSMVELGQRSMGMDSLAKLAEIEKAMHHTAKSALPTIVLGKPYQEQLAQEENTRIARLHKIGVELHNLRNALKEMQLINESFPGMHAMLSSVATLDCITEQEHRMLERKKMQLEEKLNRNDRYAQQQAEIQIYLLEMERSILLQLSNNIYQIQNKNNMEYTTGLLTTGSDFTAMLNSKTG